MRIGVDVGGTNTDAVIIHEGKVIAALKTPTTDDVGTGVVLAIRGVLAQAAVPPGAITQVTIGTTHFTNAFVERRRLMEVAVLRLSLPSNTSVRPMIDWPSDLTSVIGNHIYWAHGGYEFDGREIAPFDAGEIEDAARDIQRKGLRHVAISCAFSPINDAMEQKAAAILRDLIPDVHITLSSEVGRMGIIERENAAIMNAALSSMSGHVVGAFRSALQKLSISCPFYISQNDGTIMAADHVERFPVLTFASGLTNSMRGAAWLSGLQDAIVVDIGGTTTDVGVLAHGYPRETSMAIDVGGVRTNFRMPDLHSIGLGGGSLVVRQPDGSVTVGPRSVGYDLITKGLVFGGDILTATDIAVAAGRPDIGNASAVAGLDRALVAHAVDVIHAMVEAAIDRMKTSATAVPVILVGGGGVLVSRPLAGVSDLHIPEHAGVANAIGAAMAQVGGEADRIHFYDRVGRDAALESAKAEAVDAAVTAGADPDTVRVMEVEETPVAYMPGNAMRVRAKAVGELATAAG